jgi:NifU-like protein involved in Fe-S cluster formation
MTQPILAIQNLSAGMHKFPACVKCAILPWHATMAAVEGKGETVSTETEKE